MTNGLDAKRGSSRASATVKGASVSKTTGQNAPARGVSDAKGPHRALNHCRSGSTSVIEDIRVPSMR